MAEGFVDESEPLDSLLVDLRCSVVQNDQIITEDDHVVSRQENKTHECDSMNTNQNVFHQERRAVENSVSLADDVHEHPMGGMVGLRQNAVDNPDSLTNREDDYTNKTFVGVTQPTGRMAEHSKMIVEDSIGMSTGNVVDRSKRTVEDNQTASRMVDRRQATVEDANSDSMDQTCGVPSATQINGSQINQLVVGSTQLKNSGKIVDRQKRTVEDDIPMTQFMGTNQDSVPNTTQINGSQINQLVGGSTQLRNTGNIVDRHKRTVEDDTPATQVTGIKQDGLPITAQITGSQINQFVSGSNTEMSNTGKIVDRQKRTVEDDTPSAQAMGLYNQDAPVTICGQPNCHDSSNTQSGMSGGNMVDRQKKTVEDTVPSAEITDEIGDGVANTTEITSRQPDILIDGTTQPGMSRNMVDRQKKTVEDTVPSAQVRDVNSHDVANTTQISGSGNKQSGIAGNMVDRKKKTVEDTVPSAQVGGVNSHSGTDTAQTMANQVNHMAHGSTQLGTAGNMVDRQKRTAEDPTPSTQPTGVNNHGLPDRQIVGGQPNHLVGGVELEQRFHEDCNIVDRRQRTNSHPEKWKIQLHVNIACSKDITQYLQTSQCFEWNKPVVFGRGEDVDIFINDDHASTNHVQLMGQTLPNRQVVFMIRNASRSKGYNLNEQYITDNNQWIPINKGNQIKIAGLMFVVDIIPASAVMEKFFIEFKLPPEVHHSPVVTIPGPMYPAPYTPSGQPGFYNHYPVPGFQPYTNLHGNFVIPPPPVHGSYVPPAYYPPNHGMPMQPNWWYGGMPPGQPYHAGDVPNITSDMLEAVLQPYQGREGYVKLASLPYLACEAVGEWLELGRALGLKDWQLTIIDRDYPKLSEKSYQMLKTWVWCKPEQATLENLKRALEDITVGRDDLAVKYCTVNSNGTNLQNNANVPDSTNDGESNSE